MMLNTDLAPKNEDLYESRIRSFLLGLRLRAIRRGLWGRIPDVKKTLINLCIKLPVRFRSERLVRTLIKVVKELLEALDRSRSIIRLGVEGAWRASQVAVSWGNEGARSWRNHRSFIIYWGSLVKHAHLVTGSIKRG